MKQLKIYIIIFCVALSIPLAYLILRTYQALEQEEVAKLQYFAETIFDEMEKELTVVVLKEEGRAVDEYNYKSILSNLVSGAAEAVPSPLSRLPEEDYILGYFQNNPDGSFQTPLVETGKTIPGDRAAVIFQLKDTNRIFNRKRLTLADHVRAAQTKTPITQEQKEATGFADKYLDLSESQKSKSYLGRKEKRVEKITIAQALNIAPQDRDRILTKRPKGTESESGKTVYRNGNDQTDEESLDAKLNNEVLLQDGAEKELLAAPSHKTEKFQVEVTPLRSIFINTDQVFIFRRIVIDNQIYRQGFIIQVKAFLNHLAQAYFVKQPLSRYTNLSLKIEDQGIETEIIKTGAVTQKVNFLLNRTFPSPFDFLRATLICGQIPQSAGRGTLNIMIAILVVVILMGLFAIYKSAGILVVVILMGLFAIYKSAGAVLDLSERRSKFVSSVTHELKTPLTNMRMYIEMLEQGMARDPEREQDYFNILGSESARLSRLIDNVLELSKLEKKQRHINLREGVFDDVIQEVKAVMHEKLRQEGFTFIVENSGVKPFKYDPEVMILILINLMENSIKFGKAAPVKKISLKVRHEDDCVNIHVSDTGPGIPRHALKKIFDDFYRVESPLTRTTGGTGIGLALVKK
ncbi:MAG: HAMP domain-containing histidine kinase, partial [Deltaproteobacteria bacterium]|nr:HAMP domain-containing histidine kinase [Deltaproteobacteria bacterium]